MRTVIVGGGRTLYFLCRALASRGDRVTVIDRDRLACERLARQVTATVLCGDGSDASILEQAGARSADTLLAITGNDPDNLVICQLAAHQYGVPRVLALANDPENAAVFDRLGVRAFSTAQIIASLIEQRAVREQVTNLLPVAGGRVNVTEVVLAQDSPAGGRTVRDLGLPRDALLAAVVRAEGCLVPHGEARLLSGDRIVLVTLPESHAAALRALTGELP